MSAASGRYLPPMVAAGSVHMAVDTWLLDQQVADQGKSALRFYTWTPATVSLGYHQRQWPAHWSQLRWQGRPLALVRRPSGGRAVLHQGDLTYAIALPLHNQRRQDCYRRICDGLIAGWRQLGVDLHYGTAGRGYIHRPDCFGTATAADLVTPEGFKLIGSAQLRRGHGLLQHGSMRLWTDPDLYEAVFGVPLGTWQRPPGLPTTPPDASRISGVELDRNDPQRPRSPTVPMPSAGGNGWESPVLDRLMAVLKAAIAQQLDLEFVEQPLTAAEWTAIQTASFQGTLGQGR